MTQTNQKILFIVVALAIGIAFPYLLDMAGHALDMQPAAPAASPADELRATQRLKLACTAVEQLNKQVDGLDPDRPSFLNEMTHYQKVRPELQTIHKLVCER